MKTNTISTLFTAILFAMVLFSTTGCDTSNVTDEKVQGLQDAISTKDKTIESLNAKIEAKNSELETQKTEFETTVDSMHFSPFAIGLTGATIGIPDSVLKKGSYYNAKHFSDNVLFQDIPSMIASYIGVDRTELGKDLEDPTVLAWIFGNVKSTLPIALTITGKKEAVKFWAKDLLPYYNGTLDKAQQDFFTQYEQIHGKDFYVDGSGEDTSHVATFNFYGEKSTDWMKGVTDLKITQGTLENNYTKWLFVKRHSESAETKTKGGGNAWKNACTKILAYLTDMQ